MWKIVFPGIAMIAVTYALARYSFGLFLPEISSALNLSESQAGFVSSAAYTAYTLALLSASILIHKYSARRVALLSGGTAFLGILGMAVSQNFYTLVFSAFFAGTGSGWVSPAFSQIVSQTLHADLKDKGNTWINTGTSFGIVFTGLAAFLFAEQWRWSYGLFAVLAFAVYWWNASAIPAKKQEAIAASPIISKRALLRNARFLIIASIGIGFSSSIYWTFSRSYVTLLHGLSLNQSVVFWMIMGGAGIFGGIAGSTIQSVGLRTSYRIGVIAVAASIFGLTLSYPGVVYVSAALFGLSFIFMTGLFIVWGTRQFPESPSIGVSLSFFSLGIGQSIGSIMAGVLIEEISYPFAFISFSLVGLFFLLCKTTVLSPSASSSE